MFPGGPPSPVLGLNEVRVHIYDPDETMHDLDEAGLVQILGNYHLRDFLIMTRQYHCVTPNQAFYFARLEGNILIVCGRNDRARVIAQRGY